MAERERSSSDRLFFGGAVPILRVSSLAASLDYYVEVLGFTVNWRQEIFASASRDRCCLFLSEGDQGHFGTWVWIGVADAEAVFEEMRARGARVRHPPANYPWALELQVEDLDGNVLRLGSDAKKEEPLGEWLDMQGGRWATTESGGWRRVEP